MKEHGQAKQRNYQGSQGGQIRISDVHPRELQDPLRQVKFSAPALGKKINSGLVVDNGKGQADSA